MLLGCATVWSSSAEVVVAAKRNQVGLRPAHRSGPPSRNRTRATPDLPGGQRYVAKAPSQRELRVMPDFLCKDAYRVGERQGGAIVAKFEATLDAACRRVKFPIGNLGEVACTLFALKRFDAASARNAGTLRERRHHRFTLWRSQFGCRTDSRLQILAGPMCDANRSRVVRVAFGSKADIAGSETNVRFTPAGSTGHRNTACSLSAGVSNPKVLRGR